MPTLRHMVEALDPEQQRRLSSLHVAIDVGPRGARATVALHLVGQANDIRRDDLDLTLDPERQLRELAESGLVGALDYAGFQRSAEQVRAGYEPFSWIVKTHAGCDAERRTWLVSTVQ